jgi:uncharacterized protein
MEHSNIEIVPYGQSDLRKEMSLIVDRMAKLSSYQLVGNPANIVENLKNVFLIPDRNIEPNILEFSKCGLRFLYEPEANLAFVKTSENTKSEESEIKELKNCLKKWLKFRQKNRVIKKNKISMLSINVANTCNMECVYCFNKGGKYGDDRELNINKNNVSGIVDNILGTDLFDDTLQVVFFGGEPLLRFSLIKEFIREYKQKKGPKSQWTFSINTNGTILTEEMLEFADNEISSIAISLEPNEQTHNYHRPLANKKSSYSKIIHNLKRYIAVMKDRISVEIVYLDSNIDLYSDNAWLLNMGAMYADYGPVQGEYFFNNWSHSDVDKYLDRIEEYYLSNKSNFHKGEAKLVSLAVDALNIRFGISAFNSCGAGRQLLGISSDGSLGGCWMFIQDKGLNMGNIIESNELKRDVFNNLKSIINPKNDVNCSKCWASNICAGHCPAYRHLIPEHAYKRCYYLRESTLLKIGILGYLSSGDLEHIESVHINH